MFATQVQVTQSVCRLALIVIVTAGVPAIAIGQATPSVEQAVALAEQTGAPILAIAGRETCPNCRNLLDQLSQREFARMTSDVIPLKVDVDQQEWGAFAREFGRPDGTTLPFVYVIRADSVAVHSHSGPLDETALMRVLGSSLQQCGRALSEQQLNSIAEVVSECRTALEEDDYSTAIRELLALKRIGDLGELGSFAQVAIEADEIVQQLVVEAMSRAEAAQEAIESGQESLRGCVDLLAVQRQFGAIDAVEAQVDPIVATLRRNRETREVMADASSIDRARKLCESAGSKRRGIDALERIVEQAPDSDAAAIAREDLARYRSN